MIFLYNAFGHKSPEDLDFVEYTHTQRNEEIERKNTQKKSSDGIKRKKMQAKAKSKHIFVFRTFSLNNDWFLWSFGRVFPLHTYRPFALLFPSRPLVCFLMHTYTHSYTYNAHTHTHMYISYTFRKWKKLFIIELILAFVLQTIPTHSWLCHQACNLLVLYSGILHGSFGQFRFGWELCAWTYPKAFLSHQRGRNRHKESEMEKEWRKRKRKKMKEMKCLVYFWGDKWIMNCWIEKNRRQLKILAKLLINNVVECMNTWHNEDYEQMCIRSYPK